MQLVCEYLETKWPRPDMETDSDYRIVNYKPIEGSEHTQIFTAKGNGLPEHNCFEITLSGSFVSDKKYGDTFVVKNFTTKVKHTRANVLGYLSSNMVKGIGPALAKRIVDHFGVEALDILENDPERLREVSGIGEQVVLDIAGSFTENREINTLMLYVGEFYADELNSDPNAKSPISKKKAHRIVEHFGDQALEVIKQDIYNLCEVGGFGFKTVDAMAVKMNMPMNTLPRIKAAAIYTLEQNRNKGHLYMEPDSFLKTLRESLNHKKTNYKIQDAELRPLANQTLMCKEIAYNRHSIYLVNDCYHETVFAKQMARRLVADCSNGDAVIYPRLVNFGYPLAPEQEHASIMALTRNTCVITGGPGTGKTTVVKTILETYRQSNPKKDGIVLCAPTGRAAKRMTETTGYPAFTVHKAFGLWSEDANASSGEVAATKELDAVILDEVSMADQWLAFKIVTMISPQTKLILVGDAAQLPSVGPGNVLNELIRSEVVPVIKLKTVFRQTEGSSIAENASRIDNSITDLKYDDDFMFLSAKNQEEAMYYVCALYKQAVTAHGRDQVQILTPVRKESHMCGVVNLNNVIQRMMQADPEVGFQHFGQYFCNGDPVIQIKNADGIYNGEIGVIAESEPDKVHVQFVGTDALVTYTSENAGLLELAYSLTVHKSQGSEFPLVIVPVLKEHTFMLMRNLLYTAITRAKSRVVLVGNMWALKKAIMTEDTSTRCTHPAVRLREAYFELLQESQSQSPAHGNVYDYDNGYSDTREAV